MKAIYGKLDTTKSYTITGYSFDDFCSCDNCNKAMSNPVFIKDNDGKEYRVGLDCAKWLQQDRSSSIDYFQLKETEKQIRRDKKAIKVANTHFAFVGEKMIWFYDKPINKWSANWKFRIGINSGQMDLIKNITVCHVE
jgi:hypothetical protein